MTGDLFNSSFDFNDTPWFMYECTLHLEKDYRRITLFLLYLLLFLVGLIENSLVLWVNWRRRHSAGGVLFCILNMSLSDLLVVTIMPFTMLEVSLDKVWLWGRLLCKVTNLVYAVNFFSSSFFLAFMTLERYLVVARPTAPPCFPVQRRRRWLLCGGLWGFSLFLALLENVHVDLLEWSLPGCYFIPEHNIAEWFTSISILCLIFQFLLPATVIITCNVLIVRAVQAAPDVESRREVWLVHLYSLVFIVCWTPFQVVMFLSMLDDLHPHLFSCNAVEVLYFSFSLVQCLSLFHCVANPLLYSFLSKSFRANLVTAVVERLPAPRSARRAPANSADGTGSAPADKERKLSNTSTSQSDIGP